MALTKKQRTELRMKFGGRCAYCGCELSDKWHADHVEAVRRNISNGYAMADAVKVIDGAIAAFGAEPAPVDIEMLATVLRNAPLAPSDSQGKPRAPVVPDEDPRDAFERTFKMPKHVTRCGTGYAVTAYSAWLAHDFVRMWEGWNACRAAMLQGAEPVSQPYTLPPLDYLDTVKFNADCAIQDPDSIYTNEFFLSLDEVFGERGNYSEPVQAKAVSMLIAEVFSLRGYSRAAPHQEAKSALEHGMQRYAGAMQKLSEGDK